MNRQTRRAMDRHAKKHGERSAVLKFMGMDGLNRLEDIIKEEKAKILQPQAIAAQLAEDIYAEAQTFPPPNMTTQTESTETALPPP